MSDIFISYSRADLDKVRPIARALEAHGWDVWWDPHIRAGTPFDRVIEEALTKTRSVLVVWSQASIDSDWVRSEASYGLNKKMLISIAIERDVVTPVRFLNIHTELLLDWNGERHSPAFDKIVGDLEAVIGRPKILKKPADKGKEHPELDAMIKVPAGEFIYQDGKAIIDTPFMIDVYPVTNQKYERFIKAGGYQTMQYWTDEGQEWLKKELPTEPEFWNDKKFNQPDQPIVGVNYYEAEAYASWLGKRLPTEKEWERAARGTDGRKYPWGNGFDKNKCNTEESEIGETTPVTRYSNGISPVGCYNIAGNAFEWTDSWYDNKMILRMLRGGSWFFDREYARCDFRFKYHPGERDTFIGFRCAKTKK